MDYGHWDTTQSGEFDPNIFWGFIYEIQEIATGRSYIGKKQFRFKRKKTKSNPSKTKESDWREYTSSCAPLQESIKQQGKDKFIFRILSLCSGKCQLTYEEYEQQILRDVLRSKLPNGERRYFNNAIGNKHFTGLDKQTRDTISKKLMGHEVTEETKAKMSAHIKTKEHRAKLSATKTGKSRIFTPEHRAKIAATKLVNKKKRSLDISDCLC